MKQWILILGLIFAAGNADAQLVEVPSGTTTWTGHLRAGTPLEVVGGLGDVEVTRSNGGAFTVQIERKSTTGTPARIFVDEQRGLVCADWMSNSGATKCGSAGLLTGRIKEDAEVGLRIGVPSGNPAVMITTPTSASPSPYRRVVCDGTGLPETNRSNSRGASSGSIPGPSSETSTRT